MTEQERHDHPAVSVIESVGIPEIARIIIQEGDQHGTWDRIATVLSIHRSPDGLVIRVV